MTRVIAVYNQKGGVAKTTTCVNLAAYLALSGKKVLIIDFDPQANATSALGISVKSLVESVYHGIFGLADVNSLVKPTMFYNFHIIPSSQHLAGALVELIEIENREYLLKQLIDKVKDNYDYILIDLPPSLSLLTINGLVAAQEVLIPVQSHYLSLEGLSQMLDIVDMINKNLGQGLKISGAVLTMYDNEEKLSQDVSESLKLYFPHHIYETKIPRSGSLAEAPRYGRPVILHDPNCEGARAYEKLAQEILRQELSLMETPSHQ